MPLLRGHEEDKEGGKRISKQRKRGREEYDARMRRMKVKRTRGSLDTDAGGEEVGRGGEAGKEEGRRKRRKR